MAETRNGEFAAEGKWNRWDRRGQTHSPICAAGRCNAECDAVNVQFSEQSASAVLEPVLACGGLGYSH